MSPLSELEVPAYGETRFPEEGPLRHNNKITARGEALTVFVTCFCSLEIVRLYSAASLTLRRLNFSAG